jgi:hypothetical protein
MARPPTQTLLVIDDFLADPSKLLDEASQLTFAQRTWDEVGAIQVSPRSRYTPRLARQIAALAHARVRWHPGSGNFRSLTYRSVKKSRASVYVHSDHSMNFVGLLYLNRPEQCHGGTGFFRHCRSGLEGFHDRSAIELAARKLRIGEPELEELVAADARDPRQWIQTDRVQMKFNRLVIYNGSLFHSHLVEFDKPRAARNRLTFGVWGQRLA